jgi:hypothetical protein
MGQILKVLAKALVLAGVVGLASAGALKLWRLHLGPIHLDPTARPNNRAENWFAKLGGTSKDVDDYIEAKGRPAPITNQRYESDSRTIEEDLRRYALCDGKVLQNIKGGPEAAKTILRSSVRVTQYFQGCDRFVHLLVYVFAELEELGGESHITEAREAMAFFVYNKIAARVPGMALEIIRTGKSPGGPILEQAIIYRLVFSFLIDDWGMAYATLFWDQVISRASAYGDAKCEYICTCLFAASKLFCDEIRLVIGGEFLDTHIYGSQDVTPKNTAMYERILGRVFTPWFYWM